MHNKKFFWGPTLTEPTSAAVMHLSQEGAGMLSAFSDIMVIMVICSEHTKRDMLLHGLRKFSGACGTRQGHPKQFFIGLLYDVLGCGGLVHE